MKVTVKDWLLDKVDGDESASTGVSSTAKSALDELYRHESERRVHAMYGFSFEFLGELRKQLDAMGMNEADLLMFTNKEALDEFITAMMKEKYKEVEDEKRREFIKESDQYAGPVDVHFERQRREFEKAVREYNRYRTDELRGAKEHDFSGVWGSTGKLSGVSGVDVSTSNNTDDGKS